MKTTIKVEGMSCGHCVKHVTNALSELDNVSNVEVSLDTATAVFESPSVISDDLIKAALDDAGYEAIKIERV